VTSQLTSIVVASVRAAAIGVMDQSTLRFAGSHCAPQSLERKPAIVVGAGRPADNSTRVQVENGGEIEPALRGSNACHVGHPRLVGRRRAEVTLNDVGRNRLVVIRIRRTSPSAPRAFWGVCKIGSRSGATTPRKAAQFRSSTATRGTCISISQRHPTSAKIAASRTFSLQLEAELSIAWPRIPAVVVLAHRRRG
jgi:hypothetical protein